MMLHRHFEKLKEKKAQAKPEPKPVVAEPVKTEEPKKTRKRKTAE